MSIQHLILIAMSWICPATIVTATPTLPDGAQTLFAPQPGSTDETLRLGGSEANLGELSVVAIDTESFDAAYRVHTIDPAKARWGLQLRADLPHAIESDGVYLLSLYLRCIESTTGDGTCQIKIEQNGEPWAEVVSRGVAFGPDWTRFDFPFKARSPGLPEGQAQLTLHLGAARQLIEVANVTLYRFDGRVSLDSLPRTRMTYAGSEPDAPWRTEAAERIDKLRKSNLTVHVRDADGTPVPDANVTVRQTRHAFPFGTAMNLRYFTSGDQDIDRYCNALLDRFNCVVFENELKWHGQELRNPKAIEAGLRFAEEHGLSVRAHAMIWPGLRHIPDDCAQLVNAIKANPEDELSRQLLRRMLEKRIDTATSAVAGRVVDWDVVNEVFSNHDVLDVLNKAGSLPGDGVMVDWFKRAHAADPNAKLFINDYGILTAPSLEDNHLNSYYDTAKRLLANGAPLQGIGMQAHFGSSLTPPSRLWETLDHFATLGLPIKVTEFDMNLDDPQLMADYTRDFYTAMFAHPSVEGMLSWGFWAGRHWRPDAAYLDQEFNPRLHDMALKQLLFDTWWTNQSVKTDADGNATVRAFHGDYEITFGLPDIESTTAKATVGNHPSAITLTLQR